VTACEIEHSALFGGLVGTEQIARCVEQVCEHGTVARSGSNAKSKLGPNLREVREATGESLRTVEKRAGLTNGYLSQLERNEVAHPSPSVLRKLAKGYRVEFLVLMQWAGFVDSENLELSPNQAIALSTIGDPSDEELDALKGIVEFLRTKRTATAYGLTHVRAPLDDWAKDEIAGYARALLLEAEALGGRPTPLERLQEAADLVRVGDLELTPADRAALRQRLGRKVELGWKHLKGALDFRSRSIWIKPDLHPKQERFTVSHEIGHGILPAHQETFAYVDDWKSLNPDVRALFEQEANYAAAQLLFQCGQLGEEADSSPITLGAICDYAKAFGASIVATAREVAETSRHELAVAIAFQPGKFLGPTHLFTSETFEERYLWQTGRMPRAKLREELVAAQPYVEEGEWPVVDSGERVDELRVERMHTTYAAIVLVVRDSAVRRSVRRLFPASASSA
jgi:transcriptional regulator with XRE-family HTH domain